MSQTIRNFRNLVPYLLLASLLMISGLLMVGLLYYSTPLAQEGARHAQATVSSEQYRWQMLIDEALVADAMRQLLKERKHQAQSPRYPEIHPGELNASLRIAPLIIENTGDSRRPALISL